MKAKRSLFIVLVILLSLPLIQNLTHFFEIKALKGYDKPIELLDFSLKNTYSGEYQQSCNLYIENNIGFRPNLIRVHNQLEFSLFGKVNANAVVVGKENYLYETNYIRAYLGRDFLGQDSINHLLYKLKKIRDTLQTYNTNLFIVFAPGKASYYPQYIPDKFWPGYKSLNNYEYFTKRCSETDIPFIDFNSLFNQMKDTSKFALLPKYGIHWSSYGSVVALDSLVKYLKETIPTTPGLSIDSYEISSIPRDRDYDIGEGLNLIYKLPSPDKYIYPKISIEDIEESLRPNVITVADSYYWNIFGKGYTTKLFNNNSFWYYFKQAHNPNYVSPKNIEDLELKTELQNQDFIILLSTESNLYKFPFGFIKDTYSAYFGND